MTEPTLQPATTETSGQVSISQAYPNIVQDYNNENLLQQLINSKKLPPVIKTVEDAVVFRQYGAELGLPFMQAVHLLYMVGGKIALTTAGMTALLRRGGVTTRTIKDMEKVEVPGPTEGSVSVDYITQIEFIRDGVKELSTYSWADAKRAGLTTKDPWRQYPRQMLWNRCASQGARRVAPDLLAGVQYLAEELDFDDKLTYDENGDPIYKATV